MKSKKLKTNQPYDKNWLHYDLQKPYFLTHQLNQLFIVPKRLGKKVYSGKVVNNGSKYQPFYCIKVDADWDELFAQGIAYLQKENKHLQGWTMPLKWKLNNIGPHVTLDYRAQEFLNQKVKASFKDLTYWKDPGYSAWVYYNVKLDPPLQCPYGCHVSVAQKP